MRRIDLRRGEETLESLRRRFLDRMETENEGAEAAVREILAAVRTRGDAAALEYTRRFDCPDAHGLRVPDAAIEKAVARVQETPLWDAMHVARERIRRFHERQRRESWFDTSRPGEIIGQRIVPLQRVGIYIPGGAAAYPSTVLMVAVPARVAGVASLALATPPWKESGLPPDGTLAAARLAGVDEVYAVGGAQAIGALAFGTQSVPAVEKIVGPGNVYANLAKKMVYGAVGIDLLAGPSEVAILADETANPITLAADLVCQTEHTPNNAALVATPSPALAASLLSAVERQLADLPRAAIVRQSLAEQGYLVLTRDLEEAVAVVNAYAPEHLHVDVADPWALLPALQNAGAVLIGPHSGAAHGDYVAGPSHTLPTGACARFASPLHVDDFVKKQSVIYLSAAAAADLSDAATAFAQYEGLEGHARAARQHGR